MRCVRSGVLLVVWIRLGGCSQLGVVYTLCVTFLRFYGRRRLFLWTLYTEFVLRTVSVINTPLMLFSEGTPGFCIRQPWGKLFSMGSFISPY